MKRCPTCNKTYSRKTLKFCRADGALLEDLSNAPTKTPGEPVNSSSQSADSLKTTDLIEDELKLKQDP